MALTPEEAIAKVQSVFGSTVNSQPLQEPEREDSENDVVDLITRVCYFYPQYTFEEAAELTNDVVTALLWQAEKQKAIEYYNHVLIATAPHSKKGAMVGKLIKQYKKIIES